MRLLLLLLLAWPLLEIAGFVFVGRQIGILPTIGLTILTAIAGSALMRIQGFGVLQRLQAEAAAGRDPGRELANGVMILFAGMLLLLPGFVTDIVGLLLFLPPVRDLVWRLIKGRIGLWTYYGPGTAGYARGDRDPQTIDLDPDDYSNESDPNSPWRQIDGQN